jgi:Spy/CpxP family protein refolding chaperone
MKSISILLALALATATARADAPHPQMHPTGDDPIHSKLFQPELIMSHQQEIGMDDKQRDAIIKDIEKTQSLVTELSWKMTAAAEELAKLLDTGKVDEAKALAQADKVMGFERDIKKAHLGLLVRIKNNLTDAQRTKLVELRKKIAAGGAAPAHP